MTDGPERDDAPDPGSPFHAGERAMHARFGLAEKMGEIGRRMIRAAMPDQHRELFAQLPFMIVGSVDREGFPWASMVIGEQGFVRSPDPYTLVLSACPFAGDPLEGALVPGHPLGLLGIQLETRRRNRMNGRVIAVDQHGFSVRVDQSFGNCPKYIQKRTLMFAGDVLAARTPTVRKETARLSLRARTCIEASDTCFIASTSGHAPSRTSPAEGVDVSHRGGKPGFVRVCDDAQGTTLLVPDYSGNFMFNTVGNLLVYPRAGLLFLDPSGGDLLLLSCEAKVVFEGPELRQLEGAERLLRLRVHHGLAFENVLSHTA